MIDPSAGIYAALLVLINLGLALTIVRYRRANKVGVGHGNLPNLERMMRAQANHVEYSALFLGGYVVLALLAPLSPEGGQAVYAPWLLHGLGGAFVLGRLLHASGFLRTGGVSFGRVWGTLLTWLATLALVISLLIVSVLTLFV